MTASELELLDALQDRLRIIADEESRRDPAQHMDRLCKISERIDRAAAALTRPPPQLAHYLQRRSYDKALALLSGERF